MVRRELYRVRSMAEPAVATAVRQPKATPLAVAVTSEQRRLDIAAMHECLLAILASLPEDVKQNTRPPPAK